LKPAGFRAPPGRRPRWRAGAPGRGRWRQNGGGPGGRRCRPYARVAM